MKHVPFQIAKKAGLAMSVPMVLMLAGCQGTIHTRWVEQSDSYDYWSPRMAALPIDVHGAFPGATHVETVERIALGTTANDYAARHPTALGLEAQPRIVLYVGGDQLPTDASYCSAHPVMRTADESRNDIMIASALCDGPRLVVRSRREVAADRVSTTWISSTMSSVKSHLLYGLTVSQAQQPTEQDNG